MKPIFLSLVAIVFAVSCQERIYVEYEKKAVIAVNEEERDAYFDRDLARLEAIWIQEPTSHRRYWEMRMDGWEQIRADYEGKINDTVRWEIMKDQSVSFSNYTVNLYDKSALVYHDVRSTGKYMGVRFDNMHNRIVHLVKVDEAWKIDLIVELNNPHVGPYEEITVRPGDNK